MHLLFGFVLYLVVATVFTIANPSTSYAIPAFARQHKAECSTCHTIFPQLNEFGEAFLKNSYVYPGKPKAAKSAESVATTTAAPTVQDKKDEALWLSAIPEQIPVSFAASADLSYNADAEDKLDLATRSLRLHAGGAFRDKAGFFITYNLYTQGAYSPSTSNTPTNNRSDIDELFLVWRHAMGTPVNLKVGRFEPKLSLWKQSNKVTVTSFAPYAYTVGSSQFSLESTGDALEANAVLGSRLFVAGGIVDRDNQNTKEGYGHISYKFSGTDFLGNEPEISLEEESVWDYLTITTGAYTYFGRNESSADVGNFFYRAGADVDLLYKRLHLKFAGVHGRDNNPTFSSTSPDTRNSTVLAGEAEYMLGSPVNAISLFRYEYQDDGAGITRRYIPGIAYAPLQNTKVQLQYIYEDAPSTVNRTALLGLTFSL
ncbi:MAG: cytochrome C [Geobacter sp.]|nr:cytochrome C [Geobacter sp.]